MPESTAPATPIVEATPAETTANSAESQVKAAAESAPATDPKLSLKDAVAANSETPAETAKRKLKVKIDDMEQELDEDEVIAGFQARKASDKRFQEAAKLRKSSEELIRLLKTNPRAALEHPDIKADLRKLAEEYLSEQIDAELMTPEQKRIKELEGKLAAQEKKDKEIADKAEQERLSAQEKTYLEETRLDMDKALGKVGLPQTNYTVGRVIHYMKNALEAGEDVRPSDVVALVREDYMNDIKQLFGAADALTLESLLGEEGMKKIRTHDINKLKQVAPAVPQEKQGESRQDEAKPRKKLSEILDKL